MTITRGTALITGATSDIGFHTAAALATGHQIVVTGPRRGRGAPDRRSASAVGRPAEVRFVSVDHSVVGENRRPAGWISTRFDQLDVLVNDVGSRSAGRVFTAMTGPLSRSRPEPMKPSPVVFLFGLHAAFYWRRYLLTRFMVCGYG